MNKQELIYLSQKVVLQASPLTNDICVYVATGSTEHKNELMKRLTDIIHSTVNLMEEIQRQEFSAQITERVQAIDKEKKR